MRPRFSLAHLTVIRLSPPQVIEVAARTGYDTVGLRLVGGTEITPAYPLMDDKPLMRDAKAAMAATGVGVLDIEFVRITPETDVASLEPFAAAGAELGARYMITSAFDPTSAGSRTGWPRSATWLRNMDCARCWSSFRGPWFPISARR